ncbi:50S ribosomal protein L3 [Gammaproteobacteria bacterium]|nr:50S ribosomal protein L3 [Gammaproteobacteria bacterium]MDA9814951.1 50S ribosomal protein L3 [Gammaproteobacteria bacterium]MDB4849147.1 50S ribosomal protein L3 [Gammaproteobacteria bacterium]MDC0401366.1 50S ribosomal protein L3 [Gammaproteobacteria bacterium]MDC1074168.1 50S ribosomal protein L3 [Gammaproteobacteria bacterium]
MSIGLIGKKSGMTRLFLEDGESVPVTAVSVCGNFIADIKTSERDGYDAYVVSKTKKSNNINKSKSEFYKKINLEPGILAEFRSSDQISEEYQVGKHLTAEVFEVGQYVDVTGTSKGKGYAGVIKRHNFAMQDATHGNSLSHRAHGSIGQCQTPGRVWKGKKMSGHMGNVQKTVQSLKIVDLDVENNVIYIKGAVPGFNGSDLKIKPALKKS